mmetsp:Transcript_64549/g.120144  ORF Transcript_64549/g.120144 Transcript_64549/m.120144 type:complete len:606 (-) Transcript_64549:11-1828(-)
MAATLVAPLRVAAGQTYQGPPRDKRPHVLTGEWTVLPSNLRGLKNVARESSHFTAKQAVAAAIIPLALRKVRNLVPMRGARIARRAASRPYEVKRHEGCAFGGSVEGFDVRSAIENPDLVEQLRSDLAEHKLLLFKGQTEVTGEDHIALSDSLGSMDHGLHKAHPKAPDPRLLRVSNNAEEGFVSVGTSGWHVDGVMLKTPFAVQTMHFLHAIPGGDTFFMDMNELLGSMPPDFQDLCRRLWFVSGVGENLYKGDGQLSLLPLVFKHPSTGDESMCFHLGKNYCLGWIEEQNRPEGVQGWLSDLDDMIMPEEETPYGRTSRVQEVLRELLPGSDGEGPYGFSFRPPRPIQQLLQRAVDNLRGEARDRCIWRQSWEDGDLALIDNLALAHLPSPGTQAQMDGPTSPGLRLFHRTTMVDRDPEAVPRNVRGASSVLLKGADSYERPSEKDKVGGSTSTGAIEGPEEMGYILSALLYVSPPPGAAEEDGEQNEESRSRQSSNSKEPAWDKAVRALQEGGHSFELLDDVEAQLEEAKSNSREEAKALLKKLLIKLHPDRNPGDESIVPVFSYLRDLRKIQGPTRKAKTKVLSRLRSKIPKEPSVSAPGA